MNITYKDHIEVSDEDTKLVSTVNCPLTEEEIASNQLSEDNGGNNVVMCCIEGQELKDGTFDGFVCSYFYGAVYPSKYLVDCRNPKNINNLHKDTL